MSGAHFGPAPDKFSRLAEQISDKLLNKDLDDLSDREFELLKLVYEHETAKQKALTAELEMSAGLKTPTLNGTASSIKVRSRRTSVVLGDMPADREPNVYLDCPNAQGVIEVGYQSVDITLEPHLHQQTFSLGEVCAAGQGLDGWKMWQPLHPL